MRIQSATYNIVYPECRNIRREVFTLEDKLDSLFVKPFSLIPIPDDAPAELPRIQATSNVGNSLLSISLNSAQLNIEYNNIEYNNNDFLEDIRKCMYKVFDAISNSTNNKYLFSGLTLNIVVDDLNTNPVDVLLNNFGQSNNNIKPFDITNKVAYVYNDQYYINIECSNFRKYRSPSSISINPFANAEEVAHLMLVTLDINDRYAFNYKDGYLSSSDEVENIINLTSSILSTKIERYIKEGVFEL